MLLMTNSCMQLVAFFDSASQLVLFLASQMQCLVFSVVWFPHSMIDRTAKMPSKQLTRDVPLALQTQKIPS